MYATLRVCDFKNTPLEPAPVMTPFEYFYLVRKYVPSIARSHHIQARIPVRILARSSRIPSNPSAAGLRLASETAAYLHPPCRLGNRCPTANTDRRRGRRKFPHCCNPGGRRRRKRYFANIGASSYRHLETPSNLQKQRGGRGSIQDMALPTFSSPMIY